MKISVLDVWDYSQTNIINPTILEDNNNMVLIDVGYPNQLSILQERARIKQFDLDKLTDILITHQDFDHIGSLAAFKRAYPKITISASAWEANYIEKNEKPFRLQQAEALFDTLPEDQKTYALAFQQAVGSVEPVHVDKHLYSGQILPICDGIEVIETKGHTLGHLSFYLHGNKTLIAGDAIIINQGRLELANPQYAYDLEMAKQSIKELLDYDITSIICYHGGIFTGDCHKALLAI